MSKNGVVIHANRPEMFLPFLNRKMHLRIETQTVVHVSQNTIRCFLSRTLVELVSR